MVICKLLKINYDTDLHRVLQAIMYEPTSLIQSFTCLLSNYRNGKTKKKIEANNRNRLSCLQKFSHLKTTTYLNLAEI